LLSEGELVLANFERSVSMENFLIIAVLALILGGAAGYVYKAKKAGRKCIGCPDGGQCNCNGSCSGCSCDEM